MRSYMVVNRRHTYDQLSDKRNAAEQTMYVECNYGTTLLCTVEKEKLFEKIPYVEAYTSFQKMLEKQISDTLVIDVKTFLLDADVGMWSLFMYYVKKDEIPRHTLHGKDWRYRLNDANIMQVTRCADFLIMHGFLLKLEEIILQCSVPDLFRFHTPADACLDLQYFAFLVDTFDNTYDRLIDAVACILASNQLWRFPKEIGHEWKEQHIVRFVNRKQSFFGMERNIFYAVMVWCTTTKCDPMLKLELLLQLSVDSDVLEKEIYDEMVSVIQSHLSSVKTKLPTQIELVFSNGNPEQCCIDRDSVCQIVTKETAERQVADFKKQYPVTTRQLQMCEFVLDGNVINVFNPYTRHTQKYFVNDTPSLVCRDKIVGKGYSYDLVLSENNRCLYLFAYEPYMTGANMVFRKLEIAEDMDGVRCSGDMSWQLVTSARVRRDCGIMQATQVGTLVFVNAGDTYMYIFHIDGPWTVCITQAGVPFTMYMKSSMHLRVLRKNRWMKQPYTHCIIRKDSDTIVLYTISQALYPCMHRLRMKVMNWGNTIRETPFEIQTKHFEEMTYPDITFRDRNELPSLFYMKNVGMVCICGIGRKHYGNTTNETKTVQIEVDCFILVDEDEHGDKVNDGDSDDDDDDDDIQCVWEKRELKSEPVVIQHIKYCHRMMCDGCKRPLRGRIDDELSRITLFSGDRQCQYIRNIFLMHNIVIDLKANTVVISANQKMNCISECIGTDGYIHGHK